MKNLRLRNSCTIATMLTLVFMGNAPLVFAADPSTGPTPAATDKATPAGTPSGSSNPSEAVPNWLKEYETKPPADAPTNTPVDTTAPAAASATPTTTAPTTAAVTRPTQLSQPRPAQHTAAPKAPTKAPMLFGRIEEISGNGATLPIKLQAQQPMLDPRGQRKLPGGVQQQQPLQSGIVASFPSEWAGNWSGQLKIHGVQFDRIRWDFDPEEASREQQLLKPGSMGNVTFSFTQQSAKKVLLEPAEVVFTTTMDQSRYANQMGQMQNNPFAQLLGGNAGAMMANMPYMFAMHLGNLTSGVGVTGNQLNCRLMRNDIRQLSPTVLEQVVVTLDTDRNPRTGKTRNGYSESVLRFTKLNASQLYVQAASVNYRADGKFENKYLLYGTVNRSYGDSMPAMPGMPSMPNMFGGAGGGGASGLGALEQMLRQLQGQ